MKKIKNGWRERFEKTIQEKPQETREGIQEIVITDREPEHLPCGYQKGSPELLQQLDGQSGYHNLYSSGFLDPSLPLKEISPLAAQHDIRPRQRQSPDAYKTFPKYSTKLKDLHITQLICYKEDMIPTMKYTSRPISPIEQLLQLKDVEVECFYLESYKNKLPLDHPSLQYTPVGIQLSPKPHLSESCNHAIRQVQQKEEINGSQVALTVKPLTKSVKSKKSCEEERLRRMASQAEKKNGAPRKRKPLMSESAKQMLERAKVEMEDGMDCLYGENIDKFRELVSFVSAKLYISEEEVKAILSQNRRQVKNRGSARRSRLGRNGRLILLGKEKDSLEKTLSRLQWLTKKNLKWKKKYEKLRSKIESREYNWQFENSTSKRKFENKGTGDKCEKFNANLFAINSAMVQ